MAGPRGYHSYRGRGSKGKAVLAVFLVLIILASLAVIRLQKYIVYDETGTPHLISPVGSRQEDPASQTPEEDLNLTIQASEKAVTVRAFSIPAGLQKEAVDAIWAAAVSDSAGYTAVAVTMKDSAGKIYFDAASAVSGAVDPSISQEQLEQITGSDLHTIARLSCFHDSRAANADVEGMGLKNTGGYIFYDGNNSQWLDPGKPAARQYLCGLARELAELGFDEILLTDVTYPTVGKLDKIDYGETMKAENLAVFLDEMRTAVADYDVTLSLELPAEVVAEGSDNIAGLLLANLAPQVERIYAVTTADQAESLRQAVRAASGSTDFVPELTEVPVGDLAEQGYLITG